MKILVTGGAGFVGTNLSNYFYTHEIPFEIIDLKISNQFPDYCKIGDVRAIETLRDSITGDVIIDLAAAQGGNCELSKFNKPVVKHGVKILLSLASLLVKLLSKQFLEEDEQDPLYLMLLLSRIAWIEPSSPNTPCNAKKTKSSFLSSGRILSILLVDKWNSEILCSSFLQALIIALPEFIDTSASEESPP